MKTLDDLYKKGGAEDAQVWLRRAAEAGPGFRGTRVRRGADERLQIQQKLKSLGVEPPPFLDPNLRWIDREAKLFQAGDFPDKGVTVGRDMLDSLAGNFVLPVPVLIEHSESPLEIGFLTDVRVEGSELFGTVALTEEANALIEQSDAKALSLGLNKELNAIQEVSLVRNPRIPDAKLYSGAARFSGHLLPPIGVADWRQRYFDAEADRRLDCLVQQGRLSPAQVPIAKEILAKNSGQKFHTSDRDLSQMLFALLELQPQKPMFKELAPNPHEVSDRALMLPEEADFYRRHFPDIALEDIAQRRA